MSPPPHHQRLTQTILFFLNLERNKLVKREGQDIIANSTIQVHGDGLSCIFSNTQNNLGARLPRWNGDLPRSARERVITAQSGAAAHRIMHGNGLSRHPINAELKFGLLPLVHRGRKNAEVSFQRNGR